LYRTVTPLLGLGNFPPFDLIGSNRLLLRLSVVPPFQGVIAPRLSLTPSDPRLRQLCLTLFFFSTQIVHRRLRQHQSVPPVFWMVHFHGCLSAPHRMPAPMLTDGTLLKSCFPIPWFIQPQPTRLLTYTVLGSVPPLQPSVPLPKTPLTVSTSPFPFSFSPLGSLPLAT